MNVKNQNLYKNGVIQIALVINIVTYIGLWYLGDFRTNIVFYFAAIIPAYVSYFCVVYYSLKLKSDPKNILVLILIVGVIIRLILIPTQPILSDDIYRYLWDGKVSFHVFNPFSYSPNAMALENLRDQNIYPSINFKGIPTVYPPVSQLLFFISYLIGYNIIIWKIILLLIESVLIYFLYRLVQHFSMNPMRLSLYILNPLVVIETYSSGHLEIIAVCFLMMGIFYFYKNKTVASISLFVLSILSKYNPILIILPFLKKRFLPKITVIIGSVFLVLFPFAFNGTIPTAGMISYSNRWEFNGFIYKVFLYMYDLIGFDTVKWFSFSYNGRTEDFYLNGSFYYKIIALIILLIIVVDQLKKLKMTQNFKGVNYLKAALFIGFAMILLSPTLYPWYLILILPLMVFLPNWSWLFLTFLVQLSYYVLQGYVLNNNWQESNLILYLQYIPFYALLIFEFLDKRKIKGWFL